MKIQRFSEILCLIIILAALHGNAQIWPEEDKQPYFQQDVNYKIDVELDDESHMLMGNISIEYTNNSPDRLNYIYMHLWPNAYKDINSAMGEQLLENGNSKFYFSEPEDRGYIEGLNFTVDEKRADWEFYRNTEDMAIIYLPRPLHTGEKVTISTGFHLKIPLGKFSRLGHIGQSYQITQWYPKPAVYDRDGWHPMPYLNQGEFYSEYGSYDVKITLPANYVVGATGRLQNEEEKKWLNEKSDETLNKNEFEGNSFPPSADTTKTLHFKQDSIHDFAWFADKRFNVLKDEVKLPESGKKVTTWAMFTDKYAGMWLKSSEYLKDAIYYYSKWIGEYPYTQVTAVDGALSAGGGMEYPMVTVIGAAGSDFGLERVIMHEVGHNWFYGILGSNERDNPWMDEGFNSYYENRYIETKYPNATLLGKGSTNYPGIVDNFQIDQFSHKAQHYLLYAINARRNMDQAMSLDADEFTSGNYGAIVYGKTALALEHLENYIGKEEFDPIMKQYFNKWKFKHPQPFDVRKVFVENTEKDLDWFFEEVLTTTRKIDYKISRAKEHEDDSTKISIKIKNKGGIQSPFPLQGLKDGEIVATEWKEGFEKKKWLDFPEGDYDEFRIDALRVIPEIKRRNNKLKNKGLFKKVEPLRIQWLSGLDNPERTQLFYTPIMAWNNYDKFMAGLAFHNFTLPVKSFEFALAPMYSFGANDLAGLGHAAYHLYPKKVFEHVKIGFSSRQFSYLDNPEILRYRRYVPEANFIFNQRFPRKTTSYSLTLRTVFIEEEYLSRETGPALKKQKEYNINNLKFNIDNKQVINPYHVSLEVQDGPAFIKAGLDANYRFSYKGNNQGFDIRFYIGRFIINNGAESRFNFTFGNKPDYMYDELYLGRFETSGLLNQQFYVDEGGFKNPTDVLSQNRWMNAINLQSTIPKVPLAIYLDVGLAGREERDQRGNLIDKATEPVIGSGIAIQVVPDFFEIYFPVYLSSDLNQLTYWEKIRFTLNINSIKPFERARNLKF